MFELTGLSSFIDVFQKAFGLIEKHKDQKRKLFNEVVEPVYTELSVVVGEYYRFFRNCRDDFSKADFADFKKILDEQKKNREEIVLARNKVLGIADSFLQKQDSTLTKRKRREDELIYNFAREIHLFFFASDDRGKSEISSLFSYIDQIICDDAIWEKEMVVEYIDASLGNMEWAWRDISKSYGDLRVLCLS